MLPDLNNGKKKKPTLKKKRPALKKEVSSGVFEGNQFAPPSPDRVTDIDTDLYNEYPTADPTYDMGEGDRLMPKKSIQGRNNELFTGSFAQSPRAGGQAWDRVDANSFKTNFPGIDWVMFQPDTQTLKFIQDKSHLNDDADAAARSYAADAASYMSDAENAAAELVKDDGYYLRDIVRQLKQQQTGTPKVVPKSFSDAIKKLDAIDSERQKLRLTERRLRETQSKGKNIDTQMVKLEDDMGKLKDRTDLVAEDLAQVIAQHIEYPAPYDITDKAREYLNDKGLPENLIRRKPITLKELRDQNAKHRGTQARTSAQKRKDDDPDFVDRQPNKKRRGSKSTKNITF